jgi:uncharacterized repeat protein (TIGR03803 family)
MFIKKNSRLVSFALTLVAFTFSLAVSARAQTENILYNFGAVTGDAIQPLSGVIFDNAGNLYGTTNEGGVDTDCQGLGNSGCGTVYELSPVGSGWQETLLYSFSGGSDGGVPAAGLLRDASGNLYGTTQLGGLSGGCSGFGCGVVFELSPSGSTWTETVIHTFTGGADGAYPVAALIFDAAGNLYGTASAGGNSTTGCVYQRINGCGVAFELSPSGSTWTESVLHTFTNGSDGAAPVAALTSDTAGTLYGIAEFGGTTSDGVVFELKKGTAGVWKLGAIHTFTGGNGGAHPEAGLIFDSAGNLYGSTAIDGADFGGVVFELSPGSHGAWRFGLLHSFTGGHDGNEPLGTLLLDTAGNLYGTTEHGGKLTDCFDAGCGVVFKLAPRTGGGFVETVLHTFVSNGTDGTNPFGGLVFDSAGNLYGTTNAGGTNSAGTVFEVTP